MQCCSEADIAGMQIFCDFYKMKRIWLHIAFWVAYLMQDTLLIYLWDASRLPELPVSQRIWLAIANCSISLIPKAVFTYFILYYNLPKLLGNNKERQKGVLYLVLAFTATLFFYRALATFFIDPVFYKGLITAPPYFRVLGFLMSLMDVGFAAGAAIAIKLIHLQVAVKEKEKNLLKEKLETELKFLRNQTNPHFLFNTLNNIYALALKKSDDTPEVVLKLSKLLNFMLYESRKTSIGIGDELKILDDYIELERIRYNGRLEVSFIREIDNESEQMAPLLLLSFVENAFKHGASESRFESYIHIDMKLQNGILNFGIENNKENCEKQQSNGNIGLTNVRRQLELMYTDYDLKVDDENNRFNVGLMINLNSYAKI
jgi:two-component system, LytTR family, sensor kinase